MGQYGQTVCLKTPRDKLNDTALEEYKLKLWPKNTLLIPKSGASTFLNHRALLGEDAYISSHLATVIPNKSLLPKYLYYWSLNLDAKHLTPDTNYPSLKLSDIKSANVPVPPLETQHKIVAILEKAEETKKLRALADELTQQLLQSVFVEMFGDPVENSKGWDVKKLGDLGDWTSGGTPSRSKPEYFQGDISWFTAGELNGSYIGTSKEMITNEALEASAAKIFPAGTILIGMYDSAAFKMGILTLPSSSNQACAAFLPNDNLVNIQFLLNLFKRMKAFFLSQRRGVRQKNLNQNMIKNFEIPLPPLELQQKFAEIVDQIDKTKQYQQQSSQEVDSLFNTLMQKAFTGELVS